MYQFNAQSVTKDLIEWIKNWFDQNGNGCNAVIGMSGGKDSTVTAALLAKAIGPNRVFGVAMPDWEQGINEADEICNFLGINYIKAPIASITEAFEADAIELTINGISAPLSLDRFSDQSRTNIPARVRMTMLYALAQTLNGRVINTCNLSENFIGYETIFGDAAGDMSPLGNLTVTEILEIGNCLNLPEKWVFKTPDDGLPNSSPDEEKLGFTYADLDKGIREHAGFTPDMLKWHFGSSFKRKPMATFNPLLKVEYPVEK